MYIYLGLFFLIGSLDISCEKGSKSLDPGKIVFIWQCYEYLVMFHYGF